MLGVGVSVTDCAVLNPGAGGAGPSAPGAFTSDMWTLTGGSNKATVTLTALPSTGGSAITAVQYQLDGGAWTAFSPALAGTGARNITGLTNGNTYTVALRAVNAVGAGAVGAAKSIRLDDDLTAYVAAMTTAPSEAQKSVLQYLFDRLKGAGLWAKIDQMYLAARAPAEQAANLNIKNPAQVAVPTNTPVWSNDGYRMSGASSHVAFATNLAAGPLYVQNSGHIGIWTTIAGSTSTSNFIMGGLSGYGATGATLLTVGTSATGDIRVNHQASVAPGAVPSLKGGFIATRTDANTVKLITNGAVQFTDAANASEAPRNVSFCVGRSSTTYNTLSTFGVYCSGAGLTDADAAALDAIVNDYLNGVSAAPLTNIVNTDNTAVWTGDAPTSNTVNADNTATWS